MPAELNLFDRLSAAYKALRFPSGSESSVVGTWSSFGAWDTARTNWLKGSKKNYASLVDLPLSSLAMAAVRWVGNTVPEAPLQVREDVNDQEEDELIAGHPLTQLLFKPNQFYSGTTMWKAFAFSWVLDGNVFFLKERSNREQVIGLWYEPNTTIRVRRNSDGSEFISFYEVKRGSEWIRVEREDVVHFRDGIDPEHPWMGLAPLKSILREIYGDNEAANYYAQLVGGSGVPPLVATINNKNGNIEMTQEDVDNIKSRLKEQTSGENKGDPVVVENLDIKKLAWSPSEMDTRQSRYLAEERFCAVTGINGHVMNLGSAAEHSIYNNVTQAEESAVRHYLIPLWKHIDEELTNQLLPDFDEKPNRFVVHDLSRVAALQEDEDAKHARFREDYTGGGISKAEYRRGIGLDATPEQENEWYSQSAQVVPDPLDADLIGTNGNNKAFLHLSKKLQQQKAREHWERHAPARVKGLITAEER